MTWNGEPVTSDTVWADVSGDFTVEASWWNGRFAWSQSVQAVVLTLRCWPSTFMPRFAGVIPLEGRMDSTGFGQRVHRRDGRDRFARVGGP